MNRLAPPPGLRIEPAYGTGDIPGPLWLPPRLRRQKREDEALPQKVIYFKGRLFRKGETSHDIRWYGGVRTAPEALDLDEEGEDAVTARDQIHLYITGLLERVYGGAFVHQDTDERRVTTIIEEWPIAQHSSARWARFFKRDR